MFSELENRLPRVSSFYEVERRLAGEAGGKMVAASTLRAIEHRLARFTVEADFPVDLFSQTYPLEKIE